MKSVLCIDKPVSCMECPLNQDDFCYYTETSFNADKAFNPETGVLSDCPLKDLPEEKMCNERDFEHYDNGYGKGWNDYRRHLTGEYNHYVPEPYR